MAVDRIVPAGTAMATGRSESAAAESTSDRQWSFVSEQDGVSFDLSSAEGRKRHLLTSGLLRQAVVIAANVDDRDGLKRMLTRLDASSVSRLRRCGPIAAIKGRRSERGWLTKKDAQGRRGNRRQIRPRVQPAQTPLGRRVHLQLSSGRSLGVVDEFSPTLGQFTL